MTSSFCSRAASRVYLDVLVLRSRAWTDFSLIVAHDVPRRYTRKLSVVLDLCDCGCDVHVARHSVTPRLLPRLFGTCALVLRACWRMITSNRRETRAVPTSTVLQSVLVCSPRPAVSSKPLPDFLIIIVLDTMDQTIARKTLQELIKREDLGNKKCIDCGNPNPQWASLR